MAQLTGTACVSRKFPATAASHRCWWKIRNIRTSIPSPVAFVDYSSDVSSLDWLLSPVVTRNDDLGQQIQADGLHRFAFAGDGAASFGKARTGDIDMSGHILACDDELHIVKLVELTLRKDGHRVTGCTNGEAAWAHLVTNLPDLVICSSRMPGISGLELCRRIRLDQRTRDLPIVLMASCGTSFAEERLQRDLHLFAIIHKPFSPRELLASVNRAFEERPVRRIH